MGVISSDTQGTLWGKGGGEGSIQFVYPTKGGEFKTTFTKPLVSPAPLECSRKGAYFIERL